MEYIVRKPEFSVEMLRPDYAASSYSAETIAVFDSSPNNSALVGYSFSESLSTIDSRFTLTFTVEMDENNLTWMDKLQLKDLVIISEFGETRFAGIIEDMRFSARISGGKPDRKILITGVALSNLLSTFPLVIDQFLYQGSTTAEAANNKLKANLASKMNVNYPVANVIKEIYKSFFELSLKMGSVNAQGLGIKHVLDTFIDFDSKLSKNTLLKYPMALSIYRVGINNIWDILAGIIVAPIYELFMLWNSTINKYEAVFRQSPFEPNDWINLPSTKIPIVYLTDHDFGRSGREVYTYYLATVAGSGMSDTKAMLLDANKGYGQLAASDVDRWKLYGYKPLIIEFRYFDASQAESYTDTSNTMLQLGKMLKRWYEYNDSFITGSITFMTIAKQDKTNKQFRNPRIGERLLFLEGEFYIEDSEHTWTYGGPMLTKLSLSRGFVYTINGTPYGAIQGLGRQLTRVVSQNKHVTFA